MFGQSLAAYFEDGAAAGGGEFTPAARRFFEGSGLRVAGRAARQRDRRDDHHAPLWLAARGGNGVMVRAAGWAGVRVRPSPRLLPSL